MEQVRTKKRETNVKESEGGAAYEKLMLFHFYQLALMGHNYIIME